MSVGKTSALFSAAAEIGGFIAERSECTQTQLAQVWAYSWNSFPDAG